MNPIYELTDHAHSEEELAPWLDACGTGRETIDGLLGISAAENESGSVVTVTVPADE